MSGKAHMSQEVINATFTPMTTELLPLSFCPRESMCGQDMVIWLKGSRHVPINCAIGAHWLSLRPIPKLGIGMFLAFLGITKKLDLFSSPGPATCSLALKGSEGRLQINQSQW